jgi:hypothetical protein
MNGRQIALDDAVPGMVLAADMLDAHGSVLLPAGVSLSAVNLASLRRRGVSDCRVVDGADTMPAGADTATAQTDQTERDAQRESLELERRRQRLIRLFRGSAGIGASAVLLQLLLAYRRGD